MSASSAAGGAAAASAAETTGDSGAGADSATKTVVVSSKIAQESLFAVYRSRKSTPRELNSAAQTFLSRVTESPSDEVARALVTACTTSRTATAQHAAANALGTTSRAIRLAAIRLTAAASAAKALAPRNARALLIALAASLRLGVDGDDESVVKTVVNDASTALLALVPLLVAQSAITALQVGALSRHGQALWRLIVRKLIAGANDAVIGVVVANTQIGLAVMTNSSDDSAARGELWQLFATKLGNVRSRDERVVLLARFAPIFARTSVAEFVNVVMPAIEKQTRRAPELSLGALAFILRRLPRSLDVGAAVRASALQLALPEVRAKRDLCQADAIDVVSALAWYAAPVNGAEFRATVTAVVDPLAAEKDVTARLGLLGAVGALAQLAIDLKSVDEQRALASTTIATLAALAENETNDRVRSALFDAIEAWATLARAVVPAHAKLLAKLLKLSGPPPGRTQDAELLRGVLAALAAPEPTAPAVEHIDDKLRTLLRDAAVGPSGFTLGGAPPSSSVVVTDGILSLAVLARVAFHSGAASLVPPAVLFYSLGTNVPADRGTVDAVLALVAIGASVTAHQLAHPIARCLLSSEGAARRFTLASLHHVFAAVPASAAAVVATLRKLFDTTPPADVAWSPPVVRAACSAIAASVARAKVTLSATVATDLLLLVEHRSARTAEALHDERVPLSMPRVTGTARWWLGVARLLGVDPDFGHLCATLRIAAGADEVAPAAPVAADAAAADAPKGKQAKKAAAAATASDGGEAAAKALAEQRRVQREWRHAASDALAVLARCAIRGERTLLDNVLHRLFHLMSADALRALSKREVRIYHAAADTVVPDDSGVFVARVLNDAGAAAREAEEKRRALAVQASVRARVARLVLQSHEAIETLDGMIVANPALMCDEAAPIVRRTLPLVNSELTARRAAELISLAMHTTPLAGNVVDVCVAALLSVSSAREDVLRTPESAALVQRSVQLLREASTLRGEPLGASTLSACMPLLNEAVNGGHLFTVLDGALGILERHATEAASLGADSEYPADEMIVTLRQLLTSDSIPPRIVNRARVAIELLAGAIAPSQLLAVTNGLAMSSAAVRLACLSAVRAALQRQSPGALLSAIDTSLRRELAQRADDQQQQQQQQQQADDAPIASEFTARVWQLRHDSTPAIAALADELWGALEQTPPVGLAAQRWLAPLLVTDRDDARDAAATALGDALARNPRDALLVLELLFETFRGVPTPPESDQYMDIAARAERDALALSRQRVRQGQVAAACGIVGALKDGMLPLMSVLLDFLASAAFLDPSAAVRDTALAAMQRTLDAHAQSHTVALLELLQVRLNAAAAGGAAYDSARTGFVVLTGAVARHLPPSDERVQRALLAMVETLRTPSESVQRAVSSALAQLVRPLRVRTDNTAVQALADQVVSMVRSHNYGERRGGAFGIAGLVRGLGTRALNDLELMSRVARALGDTRSSEAREGALFAIERLSLDLGRLFEPYIGPSLTRLLQRFADTSSEVRAAASTTARAVMGQLSGFGVRQVMPLVLKSMRGNVEWRQKCGAIELLGAMAYVQPRQLSICLPQIVPKLTKLLIDTKDAVYDAAQEALAHIGAVIRNPELQPSVPLLLKALAEPEEYTRQALDVLMQTRFVHRIDAPSLSIVLPILLRGLRERDARTKRSAVQIAGNMTMLADAADLEPYVAELLPCVRELLFDALPDARSAAARALGQLAMPLVGTAQYRTLIPWLRTHMKSNEGSIERSGAAQGLAYVAGAVVDADHGHLLRQAIEWSCVDGRNRNASVREGALCLFVFLPSVVGDKLAPSLADVLEPVLTGFADENDLVRDTAQRAAKALMTQFTSNQHTLNTTLLPALEQGLFNDEWRVRSATVSLMSEMLHMLAEQTDDSSEADGKSGGGDAPAANSDAADDGDEGDADETAAADKPSAQEEKESALAALRSVMRKLNQYNSSDTTKAATKLRREVRKLAAKAGVSPGAAIDAAFRGEAAIIAIGNKSGGGDEGGDDDGDDDDGEDAEEAAAERKQAQQALAKLSNTERAVRTEARLKKALDDTRRKRVLATLFMAQSDIVDAVAEAASTAWKSIVFNTPRTLNEVMVVLLELVVESLSVGDEERREIASRSVAALVRKVGDRVLPTLLSTLNDQASDPNPDTRSGVVLAIGEVISAASATALTKHGRAIALVVRTSLQDEDESVRVAGGAAFDALFGAMTGQAVSLVLPGLLELLDKPPPLCERALDGIRNMLSARPESVLPHVLPRVAQTPLSPFRAHAIAVIAGAIGELLAVHLENVLPPLLNAAGAAEGGARESIEAAATAAEQLCASIRDPMTAHVACVLLVNSLRQRDTYKAVRAPLRVATANTIAAFFRTGAEIMSEEDRELVFDELVRALADSHVPVQSAAWGAISQLTESLPKELLPHLLETLRVALSDLHLDLRRRAVAEDPSLSLDDDSKLPDVVLPGLCLPKGLKPMLAIVLQALSFGSAEQRASAADAMARLASLTSRDALKPFGIAMVGPLIRVVADRFPAPVKCAILRALRVLLSKSDSLKQFVTQLQTTFVKSLADPDDAVRTATAQALAQSLATIGPARIDALVAQILAVVEQYFDAATLMALHATVSCAGAADGKLPAASVDAARELLLTRIDSAPRNAGDDFEESQNLIWLARTLGAVLAKSDAAVRKQVQSRLQTQSAESEADAFFVKEVEKELAAQQTAAASNQA